MARADAPGARRCVFFEHLGAGDGALVGGKNSSLGEMITKLGGAGVRVPHGFALTSAAYADVMAQTFVPIPPPSLARALVDGETNAITVGEALKKALATLTDPDDTKQLHTVGKACREIVSNAPLPPDLVAEIGEAAAKLRARYGDAGTELTVAVRSSATAEDLPDASFAGQHDSYLGVPAKGKALLSAIIACFASLYTDRAIRYRIDRGFRHEDVLMSVGVMGMVRSDKASAGVMFSVDTESGHPGVVFLTSSYGLGENVVQGAVDPDEFLVHKATYQQGKRAVMSRRIGAKVRCRPTSSRHRLDDERDDDDCCRGGARSRWPLTHSSRSRATTTHTHAALRKSRWCTSATPRSRRPSRTSPRRGTCGRARASRTARRWSSPGMR